MGLSQKHPALNHTLRWVKSGGRLRLPLPQGAAGTRLDQPKPLASHLGQRLLRNSSCTSHPDKDELIKVCEKVRGCDQRVQRCPAHELWTTQTDLAGLRSRSRWVLINAQLSPISCNPSANSPLLHTRRKRSTRQRFRRFFFFSLHNKK